MSMNEILENLYTVYLGMIMYIYIWLYLPHATIQRNVPEKNTLLTRGVKKTQPLKRPFWFHRNLICPCLVCVCVCVFVCVDAVSMGND